MKVGIAFNQTWLFLFALVACRPRVDKSQALREDVRAAVSPRQSVPPPQQEGSSPISIHLFDEDEKIFVFPATYLDDVKEFEASPQAKSEALIFDQDAFWAKQTEVLELGVGKILAKAVEQAEAEKASVQGLGLVKGEGPTTRRTRLGPVTKAELDEARARVGRGKVAVRLMEGVQAMFRSKEGLKAYFEKAVKKKWQDSDYAKYNQMPAVTSTSLERLVGQSATMTPEGKTRALTIIRANGLVGREVRLGMLPNLRILTDLQTDAGMRPVHLMSVVEEFEMKKGAEAMEVGIEEQEAERYSKGRYRVKGRAFRESTGLGRGLSIFTYTRYSTPDRTMMTRALVKAAIDELKARIQARGFVLVHCKSGKGRSASVVVGARVDMLIDEAQVLGIPLRPDDIDAMLDEQIVQVKEARSEVGISPAQLLNLKSVLYRRIGIDLERGEGSPGGEPAPRRAWTEEGENAPPPPRASAGAAAVGDERRQVIDITLVE